MTNFHFLTTSALLLLLHSLPSNSFPLPKDTSASIGTSTLPVANPPTCLFPGDPGRAPSSDCQSALSQLPNTTTPTHFHTALTPNITDDFILPLSKSHGSCNITIGLLPATTQYTTTSWRQLTNSAAGLIKGCQENFDTSGGAYSTGGNTSVVLPASMQASTSPHVSMVGWTLNVTSVEPGVMKGGKAPLGYGP